MAWSKTTYFLLSLILLSHLPGEISANDNAVNLTTEEQQWLQKHPVIRIAPDPNFAPFEWFSQDGDYQGMAADYVRLIEERLSIKFRVVHADNWPQVMDLARAREVDVLPAVGHSSQREKYFLFTEPLTTRCELKIRAAWRCKRHGNLNPILCYWM